MNPTKKLPEYITTKDIATALGVDIYTVHRWAQPGGWLPRPLRMGKGGRWLRWRRDVIEKFLREREGPDAASAS